MLLGSLDLRRATTSGDSRHGGLGRRRARRGSSERARLTVVDVELRRTRSRESRCGSAPARTEDVSAPSRRHGPSSQRRPESELLGELAPVARPRARLAAARLPRPASPTTARSLGEHEAGCRRTRSLGVEQDRAQRSGLRDELRAARASSRNQCRRSSHGTAAFAGDVDGRTKSARVAEPSAPGRRARRARRTRRGTPPCRRTRSTPGASSRAIRSSRSARAREVAATQVARARGRAARRVRQPDAERRAARTARRARAGAA